MQRREKEVYFGLTSFSCRKVMLDKVRVNEDPLAANDSAPRYGRSAKLLLPFTVKNANECFVQNMFVYMSFQSERLKLRVKNLY